MKRDFNELEPGILKNFRRFIVVRITLVVFFILMFTSSNDWRTLPNYILLLFAFLDPVLLLAFLSIPKNEQIFKRFYFPIAVVWSTPGPIILMHISMTYLSIHTPDRSALLFLMQPILVLFIPLVVVSWQYTMKEVVGFSIATFCIDIVLVYANYHYLKTSFFIPILGTSFMRTVVFLLVGNMIVSMMNLQRHQKDKLIQANERITRYATTLEQLTTSRERNRMARELHDVLAHTMSGVAVELEGVRTILRSDPDQAEQLLGHSLGAVRAGLTETRRSLQALRATPLEDLGLGLAITNLAESIDSRAETKVTFRIDKKINNYPVEVQHCFYRVAQEALSNIDIHARASHVEITLQQQENGLRLYIRDDGVGFDLNQNSVAQKYGLLGMRERAEMIQGKLNIESQPGKGTQITLEYGEIV